ncbi:sortase [Halobacillus halophilus]|uniref:Peptidase C60 sortase A and B n=1 Tax=Halobacillus halophilus (strain ATCC 35676 / DSM 2266 / JCM 20832 / KCTC 3685 / LMG 17431 / NBRC 102448 / NCIMB 2269) TaxID=866895 RepID=I0JJT0_HALH3|nr:class F sortase [Halobacillus halophilus]ASF38550.1 sortase [Halobacillus halophilus]CCG44399.1 peptidase C60 sortase A and B [Halobacillus halophilus DSM 2266]
MRRIVYPITLGFLVFVLSFQLLKDEPSEETGVLSNSPEPTITQAETIDNKVSTQSEDVLEKAPIKKNYEPAVMAPTDAAEGIVPVRLTIPSIDVDAPIAPQGYTEQGGMAVPNSVTEVGWFEPGTKPGATGNSVIAGHVDGRNGPAVFYDLKDLKAGDSIYVEGKGGEKLTYTVQKVVAHPLDNSPIRELFGPTNEKALNLITCTGPYDDEAQEYTERLAVYTVLSSS